MYKKSTYIPGTYHRIPDKLCSYKSKFKQVGLNVFVIIGSPQTTLAELMKSKVEIRELAKTKGLAATLGDVVKAACGTKLRRATAEEAVHYHNAKALLDKYIAEYKAKVAERKQARIDSECKKARALLTKYGRLTETNQPPATPQA